MRKITVTLRELNPEAAEMWAYDLNGELSPDNVGGRSEIEAYFRCLKNPMHVFKKRISKMTSSEENSYGCIYCGPHASKVFSGETDLLTKCQEANDRWDYELNDNLDPTDLFPNSNKHAYFKCSKGHSVKRKIMDFYKSTKCPECEKEKTKLIYQVPNTQLFWNYSKNIVINLDKVIYSSRESAYFKCPNCAYGWASSVILWSKRRYCPCCGFDGTEGSIERNRSLIEKNKIITFRMANPEDADMWDYKKNNDLTPDNVLYGSNKKVHFKCKKGHGFKKAINEMTTSDGKSRGCPHCKKTSQKALSGENDFFKECPMGKEMWDYNENIGIEPETLLKSSGIKAHFKCSHGHTFIRRIQQFTKYPKCPKCDFIKNHSIVNTRPETLEFWDYEKNTLSPYEVTPYSKDEAYWRCKKCGHQWSAVIANRATAIKNKCPSCDMGRVFSKNQIRVKNFRNLNPEASNLWIDEMNNGLTPDNTAEKSGKTVYMRCINNSEHIYQRAVYRIPKENPFGCPFCFEERSKTVPGKTDLFTICENAKDMWNQIKNEGYDVSCINPKLPDKVCWKCEHGHDFERAIKKFVISQKCPKCKKIRSSIASYPHMVNQWDYEKNKDIDINNTSANSKELAWWKCKKCGFEWPTQIFTRKISKGLCPCCENRTVIVDGITDLFSIVPNLKQDYYFKKNIDVDIATLSVTTLDPVWWKCHTCGYEWKASPNGRIKCEQGEYIIRSCPACIGLVRTKTYAEEYPQLVDRFIEELNGCTLADLKGEDYNDTFWWHCNICNENFETSLCSMIHSKDSQNKGCSYCAGKKVKREKSFACLHPEVMDEYDSYNTIDPYNVTERSNKLAKWICRNNSEHKWEARFLSRAKGIGGCNICRGYHYDKIFADEHPDFEPYYDTEKNSRPFNSYSNMSNEYVWWKCDKWHSFEWQIMNFSRLGRFECPICSNKIVSTGENDLESQYQDLATEFDVEKNGITPDKIAFTNTNVDIWWKCSEGHVFQRSVWYRINQSRECPICSRSIVVKGENDFQKAFPNIVNIWDYEVNGRKPDEISDRNNGKYAFKCEHGHHYETQLVTIIANEFKCLVCIGKIIQEGVNSLADTHKELAKEFSPNEERKPSEFAKNSAYSAKWLCPTCGGEYRYPINEREVGDDSCPYCRRDRVLLGYNSFVDTDYDLSKEWSPSNERGPETYIKTHKSWVSWLCPTCSGEYRYPINERELGDDSCPYCHKDRALLGYNSLVDTDFDLSKEWGSSNERSPETYTKANKSWVSWLCPTCSGEYRYPINERVLGDDSCPFCRGTRVLAGFNSFKHNHLDLMEEWDDINNYLLCDADNILDSYSDKVWWICKDCNHKYQMTPKQRIYYQKRHMKSCPHCKGLRQKKRHFF